MRKIITYCFIVLFSCAFVQLDASAQGSKPNKYSPKEIKSVFIYSFLKYIDWPDDAIMGDELVIGVLGENPFSPSIERIMSGRTINGKKLVIKQFDRVEEGAYYCHVLYISSKLVASNLKHILNELKDTSVLTISESTGFCEMGGMINFSKAKYKYGFELSLIATKRVNLSVSSKLTGLATKILE